MVRASDNFVLVGTTPYAHEQAGIDFVREQLPPGLHARALIDMFEPHSGRHYELDFIVIGYHAVYVVEMKDYEGRVEGDTQHWRLTRPGDARSVIRDNPLSLTNHKSKVLKGMLERYFERHVRGQRVPFVQPLIFLSNPAVDNRLVGPARTAVVDRSSLIEALQSGRYPGASAQGHAVNGPQRRGLIEAFDKIGLRPRETSLLVNGYVLGPVIADGPGYQDRDAQHENTPTLGARARVYLVPQRTTVDERDRLRRAARRETALLSSVQDHPGILQVRTVSDDAPLGPTLLFEAFPGGAPLDAFLEHELPSFDEKLAILRQLGHALGYCHRREVIHGGLHPGAVLVRRHEGELQVKLCNFQLGDGRGSSATSHRTMLISERATAYQAPELAHDPRAVTRASDCYSLGALAYFMFTGHPPGTSLQDAVIRVHRDRCLDPLVVVDDLPTPLVETIRAATNLDDRLDEPVFLVENLVSHLREIEGGAEPESTAHVLEAETGDLLAERYSVHKVLGTGASARVLEVQDEHDKRRYALKVARSPEHNDRLQAEADALRSFEHPRIVKLHDRIELDCLLCLLLSLAGEQTLYGQLLEQGPLTYELALRYGEDLLDALEQCEEAGVLHRDIKPANLGIGASIKGRKKHLTLFDFSLAATPLDKLDVGTAPYRDPFLWAAARSSWDAAADRWSAAITLHEMLTAERPHFAPEGLSPLDAGARLVLLAERFDPAARDSLVRFFEQALAREVDDRFASAREMKRAWSSCFERQRPLTVAEPAVPTKPVETEAETEAEAETQTALPSRLEITKQTPIRALPLSPRALNALDRAGLCRAEELLSLANNRLSAIRGIGSKVAHEILDLRDRWRATLDDADAPTPELFHPDYRGPERYLDTVATDEAHPLSSIDIAALGDAGLYTTGALARAPRVQVETVLARVGAEPQRLHELLAALERPDTDAPPATLEAWIAALDIDGKKAADIRLRQLFGLEPPFVGRSDVTTRELAEHTNSSNAAITRNLADAIKHWREQPWSDTLRSLALSTVDGLGGVAPLALAAQALRGLIDHDPDVPAELSLGRCVTILRVAAELGTDARARGLILRRRVRGSDDAPRPPILWLVARDELWHNIDNLGRKADELASRPVLAASGETERVLELVVENTSLSARELGLGRLVELAAWASRNAAASSRLELYPIGMPPNRALELSAQALSGSFDPPELVRRISNRYPEAAPLPPRPELDRLLEPLRLSWNDAIGKYERPSEVTPSSSDTSALSLLRPHTVLSTKYELRRRTEAQLDTDDFDQLLRTLVQDRKLRVFAINSAYLPEAIPGLERVMGTRAVALDKRLIAAMTEFVRSRSGPVDILPQTDAAGPDDGHWAALQNVARMAAQQLAAQLLPPREPLLLIQLGLLARYDLRDFVRAIVDATHDDRSEAIVIVNPIHEGDRPDVIAGRLPIPGLLPGQIGHIPRPWLRANADDGVQAS
jgi:serine/threonine protein kinase